jgi:predicted porin
MPGGKSVRHHVLAALAATALLITLANEPAKAADFGGDCCADLEERVAELEATTARKGNKRVSVTLYGQENHAVLFWDDGAEKNTYVVDNNYESSRFGLKGSATTGLGDWVAGYRLEIEPTGANSSKLNQFDDDNANDSAGPLNVRHSFIYLSSEKYGEGRMGLTATPIYNITKDTNVTELEDTMHSDNRMMQGFFLRSKGYDSAEGLSKLKWQNISSCYDSSNAFVCSTRKNGVAYWSPDLAGFSASVGYFEDDEWGAALRYKKQWGETFEVGAGVGYSKNTDERYQSGGGGDANGPNPPFAAPDNFRNFKRDVQDWAGSASIKHNPTGLFAFSAFSFSETDDTNTIRSGVYTGTSAPQMNAWGVEAGIQRDFEFLGLSKLGETSFWGGYEEINNGLASVSLGGNFPSDGKNFGGIPADRYLSANTIIGVTVPTEITGSQVTRWSLDFDQAIDSANLHLYAVYQHLTPDVDLVTRDPSVSPNGKLKSIGAPLDDFDLFYSGARIYF